MDTTFLQTTDMSSWARGIANLGGANVQQGAMDSWMERPSSAHGGAYAVAGILGACAIAACARGRLAELEKQDERLRKRREVSGATEQQSSALEKAWLEAKTKQSTRNFQAKDGHLSAKVSNRTRSPQPPTTPSNPGRAAPLTVARAEQVMEDLWEQYDVDSSSDLDRRELAPLIKEVVQIMRFDLADTKEKLGDRLERDVRDISGYGLVDHPQNTAIVERYKKRWAS